MLNFFREYGVYIIGIILSPVFVCIGLDLVISSLGLRKNLIEVKKAIFALCYSFPVLFLLVSNLLK